MRELRLVVQIVASWGNRCYALHQIRAACEGSARPVCQHAQGPSEAEMSNFLLRVQKRGYAPNDDDANPGGWDPSVRVNAMCVRTVCFVVSSCE
jgi:hypothetical protein